MRNYVVFMILASLIAGAASAAEPASLVQNEYAFARTVADHGVRDGFLMYLDQQSITFAPQPVNAYDLYTQRKPGSAKLSWYPAFALVSADGGFGVDTGPWTAEWMQDGKPQSGHGEWLTVWARDKSGAWRALFDGGVSHPAPETPTKALPEDAAVTQLPAPIGAAPTADEAKNDLMRRETAFSNAGLHGVRDAYGSVAADDIRFLPENSYPLLGRDLVLKAMSAAPADLVWVPLGGSVAKSADLGYIYGMTYKPADEKHQSPQGVYMHVWRRDAGDWKLIIAEEVPLVQPPK